MGVQLLDVILVKAKMKLYTIAEVRFSFFLYFLFVLCLGKWKFVYWTLWVVFPNFYIHNSIQDIYL